MINRLAMGCHFPVVSGRTLMVLRSSDFKDQRGERRCLLVAAHF